ncbi:hypothetical protein KXD40_009271 [Peronospora effusa]|nr:hypothetical protein KXD40_009271 [Peronospora effusa]
MTRKFVFEAKQRSDECRRRRLLRRSMTVLFNLKRADANDIESDDTGKHKRQKVYRDAATIDDLIDVYAVYHLFAADAEEEGVDEEPRMEMNNEEVDESKEEETEA